MVTVTLTEEQAIAITQAFDIISNDTTHDSWGDVIEMWEEFDCQMTLDDLGEAANKIKEAMKNG